MKLFLGGLALMGFSLTARGLTNSVPALEENFQSLVMIRTEARDPSDGTSAPAYCNATFVHPQILITAAHCLLDARVLKEFSVEIDVGKYKFGTLRTGVTYRVGYVSVMKEKKDAQFLFSPQLNQKISRHGFKTSLGVAEDLALIILKTPMNLPESVRMMPTLSQSELRGLTGSALLVKIGQVWIKKFAVSLIKLKMQK